MLRVAVMVVVMMIVGVCTEVIADRDSQYREGVAALKRGDFRIAYDSFQPLAEQGDSEAQNALGSLYTREGWTGRDIGEAARWYRKAADQGNTRAMYNLGNLHRRHRDFINALTWYRKAAERGHAGARKAHDDLVMDRRRGRW